MNHVNYLLVILYHHFIEGIFNIPKLVDTNLLTGQGLVPLTIICDNIRDPGNIGSILRCAAAIGCQRLVTTKGNLIFHKLAPNKQRPDQ